MARKQKLQTPQKLLAFFMAFVFVIGLVSIISISQNQTNTESHASTSTLSTTITYTISKGWNAVSFPFALPADIALKINKPINIMAYDILTTNEANNNSQYSEMDGYSYGQWTPSVFFDTPDQIGLTGKNFPLVPGTGYVMNSDVSGIIQVSGVIPTTPITVQLHNGWNIIGIPNGQVGSQASDVLYNLVRSGFPIAGMELDRLINGQWQKYTLGQNQYNSFNDFYITNSQSYALNISTGGVWTENVYPYPKGLKVTKKYTSPSTNVLLMPSN